MKIFIIPLSVILLLAGASSCGKIFAENKEEAGAFEYRDIYLPDYNAKANADLGLDIIDKEWGIWGHNLSSVLPDKPSMEVFAQIGGGVKDDQFCFTSDKLYSYIVDYIHNNYMFSDSLKFAILPNDNDLVCLCNECVRVGNTKGDASPAVFNMIEKLSKKFPEHDFFTSYYSTTSSLPDKVLPKNAGVIISAMDYPLTAQGNSKEMAFIDLLNQWDQKTDKIYIWDYVNNFDDYFTPAPIFSIMQRRLKLYKDSGVTGVFLNGSGNDYSVFTRLKKQILADLLKNPDLDWESLLRKYADEFYPTAGKDIADFIILQEKMIENNGKALPLYEGVVRASQVYLPESDFIDFYNKMVQHKRNATGAEKDELERMTDAMAYTMLELKRIQGDTEGTAKLMERLGRLPKKGTLYYNEGAWSIDEYLSNYEFMLENARQTNGTNLLKGVKLRPVTALDEDYPDISIVTDGLLGIPSNYHNGNLITSADPAFSVSIPRQPGMSKLKVWLVYNPAFKIGLPAEAYLTANGNRGKVQIPEKPVSSGHTYMEFDVPSGSGDIVLTLKKDPEVKTMAIDEIEAY